MYSELFVAQHHAAPVAGGTASTRGQQVGYFASFDEAVAALDTKCAPGCWQGIRRDATRERWWRTDAGAWHGPHRPPRR